MQHRMPHADVVSGSLTAPATLPTLEGSGGEVCMHWLEWGTLFALLAGLGLVAETFRAEPMWLHIRRERPGPSPGQRRLIGAGITLAMAGQLLALRLQGDTPLWALSVVLVGAGLISMLVAGFRGPTRADRQRRARLLEADQEGAD